MVAVYATLNTLDREGTNLAAASAPIKVSKLTEKTFTCESVYGNHERHYLQNLGEKRMGSTINEVLVFVKNEPEQIAKAVSSINKDIWANNARLIDHLYERIETIQQQPCQVSAVLDKSESMENV